MQDKLWKRMFIGSAFSLCAGIAFFTEHWWGHAPFWVSGSFFGLTCLVVLWCMHTYKYHKDWE